MLRTIDLTNPLTHNTPIYPSDPPFIAIPHATHARDGYSLHRLSLGTHTGTHLDAPFHFDSKGTKVGDLPLGKLVGKVWVVDLEDMNLTERERVDWETFASKLPTQDELSLRDTILLINTSWSSRYYYGDTRTYFSHPYLSPSIANHLLALGISVVGVDTPSPDETPREDGSCEGANGFGFHETFLGNGGVIVENLANLKELSLVLKTEIPSRWMVSLAPLKLEGLDGSPVRAFAFCVPYDE